MSSGAPTPVARQLPARPAYFAPVPDPEIRRGEDVRVVALRLKAAFAEANDRLKRSAALYDQIRTQLARP